MKALVWNAPEQMDMQQMDAPTVKAGEVIIRTETVGICGSEIEGYLGHNSLRKPPLIMGHEFAGELVSIGPGVEHLQPGQRVVVNPLIYCGTCPSCVRGLTQLCSSRQIIGIHRSGAFAEYVAVPASTVSVIADHLSTKRAALTEPLACSLRATRRAMARHPFGNVLVIGAGGIGLLCAKVARILGASTVLVMDTNEERLKLAAAQGADLTVQPGKQDLTEIVRDQLGSRGLDVVIDAVGLQPTRDTAIKAVNPGGTVMYIGLGIDETTVPVNYAIRSEIDLLGSFCYSRQDFADSLHLLTTAQVTEEGWTEVRKFEEGPQSFRDLVQGKVSNGKIFLQP